MCLALSADDTKIFTGHNGGTLLMLDVKQPIVIKDFENIHKSCLLSVQCTTDSKYIITCDNLGNMKQWDLNEEIYTPVKNDDENYKINCVNNYQTCHKNGINLAELTHDNRYIITADEGGELKKFNLETYELVKEFLYFNETNNQQEHYYTGLCIGQGDRDLVTSDTQGTILLWNLRTAQIMREFKASYM